jgi:adenosylmethionine-8-amino-7-oxononanoate aminotransferase
MKLARQYFLELSPSQPIRTRFIARHESYHGTTLGSLSMGGHRARRKLFEPMLSKNTSHVSACNSYRGRLPQENIAQYVSRLARELEDEFQKCGPETICAFVAEPVVGAVGPDSSLELLIWLRSCRHWAAFLQLLDTSRP